MDFWNVLKAFKVQLFADLTTSVRNVYWEWFVWSWRSLEITAWESMTLAQGEKKMGRVKERQRKSLKRLQLQWTQYDKDGDGGWVIPSVFLEKCHSGKDIGERGELEEGRHEHEKVILPSGNETNYHLFILVSCFERWSKLISVSPRPQQQV